MFAADLSDSAKGKPNLRVIAGGASSITAPAIDVEQHEDNPGRFFSREGLLAQDLAHDVMTEVTCGYGVTDQRLYVYEGGVWRPDDGQITSAIVSRLGNRYRKSHGTNVIDLIRYSADLPRITGDPLPEHINVRNGLVDWRTGTLTPHTPEHLGTVQLPVDYDPAAKCPRFEQFIKDVLPADCRKPIGNSPGFIWELVGYTLYSGNPHHAAVLLYGKGRNGKGTLIRVIKRLVGARNSSSVTLYELVDNRFRAATLYGKLINLAGDMDSRWLDNTATFKAMTGGDTIQGEIKYGAVFDFTPWALPFYSINKPFSSADSSEGWWARWIVVPFPNTFTGKENRNLDAQLQTDDELRGILARGIQALPALMERGRLLQPKSVQNAKAEFIVRSDAVRSWIDEDCTLDADAWTPRTHLYTAYCHYADAAGAKRLSSREYYNRLDQIDGIQPTGRKGVRGYRGIRLIDMSDWVRGPGSSG
ncbi:hypothetical protein A5681_09850 [Mycobacterium scrofulaceum]|uniref:DNA primase family protein n=1 Tax=Mycobacterium scrofulaceum TaxID=1783 RepID=UPI000801E21A|nr:phage/plasmid primase, P4 family [Mycobacterium scrofulaceum]OBH75932.1 hypothetical protein A5681_09850 [Mycobacterium scrofulaceum]